jgi:preprotein translocase SecE subunit
MPGGAPLAASDDSRSFVSDTLAELKRVVWPSKDEVVAGTVVTIGMLLFFSLYIFGLDKLASSFFKALGFYS